MGSIAELTPGACRVMPMIKVSTNAKPMAATAADGVQKYCTTQSLLRKTQSTPRLNKQKPRVKRLAGKAKSCQSMPPVKNCSNCPMMMSPPPIASPSRIVHGLFHMMVQFFSYPLKCEMGLFLLEMVVCKRIVRHAELIVIPLPAMLNMGLPFQRRLQRDNYQFCFK